MAAKRVEISGAGFAGLTAAAAFAQRGWSVRVHERADSLRTAGAGIFIFENGLKVLRAIGAYDEAVRGAHLAPARETRDCAGRLLARHPTSPSQRVVTIVRQQLLESVAQAARRAGAEICMNSEVVGATPQGDLRLADGRTSRADLVIAADGVHSRIRDSLGLLRSRVKLGDGAIRVLLPRRHDDTDRTEEIIEHWSGKRRLLYVPCSQAWLYLALTTLNQDEAGKSLPLDVAAWTQTFPHLRGLIERVGAEGRWDEFEMIRLRRWSSGRVAVMGDAAHAQAPNLGQGGGCAMMSALGLAVAVQQAPDVATALQAWERAERPLIEHTQRVSRLYSTVGRLPEFLRSRVFSLAGRSAWMVSQRMRAANHCPTGAR
ncbi:FAD-dependent oxidoreductase [Bordetella trematum]|uniref:FAD-dependent oxidoreductase n=1 Tax=Bordetella trematum TaxID=123899 RepID=UPI000D877ECE|nr:NAD(P)/FAD-dependent oxidoreductase [Bordetella trematum]SPU54362.1 monooxygenase [Bordetella trematum]VDH02829.1 6-hydroxynicotinate 3-monooxygenase precursor [Bordetella trematum]